MNTTFLDGLREEDEEVILEIYKLIFPKVKRFIIQNKGGQQDAEDIFHEALYLLVVRLKKEKFILKVHLKLTFLQPVKIYGASNLTQKASG